MKKLIFCLIILSLSIPSYSEEKMSSGEAALKLIFFPLLLTGQIDSKLKKNKKDIKKEKKVKIRQPAMENFENFDQNKIEKPKEN